MSNNDGLNTSPTPEQLEKLEQEQYAKDYASVKTRGSQSNYTVLAVNEDGIEEPREPVKQDDPKETEAAAGTPPVKEDEPTSDVSQAGTVTPPTPPGKAEEDNGSAPKPPKPKKPSVFDEARKVHDTLDSDNKTAVGKLLAHASTLEKTVKDLQHRISSDDGRVRGMQRTIDELRNQLAALQSKPQSPPVSDGKAGQAARKTGGTVSEQEINDFIASVPKLKRLAETDRDMAEATAEALLLQDREEREATESKTRGNEEAKEREAARERYLITQAEIIKARVPRIGELLKDQRWQGWIASAPKFIQQMAASDHAEEVLHVIENLFFPDLAAWEAQQAEGDDTLEETPAAAVVPPPQVVDRVVEERSRRAKPNGNVNAPSTVARPSAKAPLSEEEEFSRGYASVPRWSKR